MFFSENGLGGRPERRMMGAMGDKQWGVENGDGKEVGSRDHGQNGIWG